MLNIALVKNSYFQNWFFWHIGAVHFKCFQFLIDWLHEYKKIGSKTFDSLSIQQIMFKTKEV